MSDGLLVIGTRRYSSWSLRGWLAVHLAGLDVDERVIPITGGGTLEIARDAPSGTVPFLDHKGARMWESLAICEYCAEIAQRYGRPTGLPARMLDRSHPKCTPGSGQCGKRCP